VKIAHDIGLPRDSSDEEPEQRKKNERQIDNTPMWYDDDQMVMMDEL
jgi:hypothetical protein